MVQENTPPQQMGRVFGAFLAFAQAGIPFGAAIAGLAIELASLIPTIAAVGAVYVVVLTPMFFNPALRRMGAGMAAAREPMAAQPAQLESSPQARRSATIKGL